jgi:hypothetical protein
MGVWRRRLTVLLGIVVVAVGAATGVDKYDERTCSGEVTVIRVGQLGEAGRYRACEGFLPW